MLKKRLLVISIIVFIITLFCSIYVSSSDNIKNYINNYEKIVFDNENIIFNNLVEDGNAFVSESDPTIIINDINTYIHSVKINGRCSELGEKIQVFYLESPAEVFSEDKSLLLDYNIRGGDIYFNIDKTVSSLRIDLIENAGAEISVSDIVVNENNLTVSFSALMTYCLFPTLIIIMIAVFVMLRKSAAPYLSSFKKYISLLINLIERDLKVKYRRSVLGFLWSILNPLLMALVITVVFSKLFRFQIEYFTIYYLTGSLLFNFFVEATTGSLSSVISAAPLIKKVYIPKYIFPMQKCIFAFINMLFGIVALLVVIFIQGMPLTLTALLFWVPMIYVFVFAVGIGLILASLTVFFRDIEHLYSVLTTVWMYLTPIIYPEDILPQSLLSLVRLNPMYYYVNCFREIVMEGVFPSVSENIICMSFSLLFLCIGVAVFKKTQDRFILYI